MASIISVSPQISGGALAMQRSGPGHLFQPLLDPRWADFLKRNPRSSVFHSVEWVDALRRTYGYEPVAITTCPPGAELRNAAVFCRVKSWLTKPRLVSLPFSDHCEILADSFADAAAIVSVLREQLRREDLHYIEARPIRPLELAGSESDSTYSYCLHQIDLRPDLATLFENCHKSSIQRKIRRAEREGLVYEAGRSETLLDAFYQLMLLTRRRHFTLPQPKRWFRNLIDCFGEALKIRVAFKDGKPVASILTLRHKDTLVFKYGCSNAQFHRLGGVQLLFWKSIEEAKRDGLRVFDLGRSELENNGLITFKDRLGAARSTLTYVRFLDSAHSEGAFPSVDADLRKRVAAKLVPHLPEFMSRAAGSLLCRHLG
jgi:CelD/BcsL family acetyltransferase involved in cellulose biosynthesis